MFSTNSGTMGNTGGIISKIVGKTDPIDPHRSTLLSTKLIGATEVLHICTHTRKMFVSYFLEGLWIPCFIEECEKLEWQVRTCTEIPNQENFSSFLLSTKTIDSNQTIFESRNEENQISILLCCAFRYFLQSKLLRDWLQNVNTNQPTRCQNCKLASQTEEDNITISTNGSWALANDCFGDKLISDTDVLISRQTTRRINHSTFEQMLTDRLNAFDETRIESILTCPYDGYLRNTLQFVYDSPFAISVAAVSPSYYHKGLRKTSRDMRQFFPIVYVNHAYEQLMQFPSYDLEGFPINCLFDASVAGESVVDAVEKSLEEMKPLQTLMKMERRSGEIVDTWLATCPVFNSELNLHTHVIMIQCSVSQSICSAQDSMDTCEGLEEMLCLLSTIMA